MSSKYRGHPDQSLLDRGVMYHPSSGSRSWCGRSLFPLLRNEGMTIPVIVSCSSCRSRLKVPRKLAYSGKPVHCPKCSAPVRLPNTVPAADEYDVEPVTLVPTPPSVVTGPVILSCPHCHARVHHEPTFAGEVAICPDRTCGGQFQLPASALLRPPVRSPMVSSPWPTPTTGSAFEDIKVPSPAPQTSNWYRSSRPFSPLLPHQPPWLKTSQITLPPVHSMWGSELDQLGPASTGCHYCSYRCL
jgi:hypothetical protein